MANADLAITPGELNRATLARQMLLERADVDATTGVERLIGMQAQEARPPFIGLWSRLQGFARDDAHRALHDRALVRATLMRGTIHLFSADDYRAFRPAIQPVLDGGLRVLGDKGSGLDIERVLPVAQALLRESPLPFPAIRDHLQARFPEVNDRALGYTVRMLLPLVMMPTEHRWGYPANAAFGLADDWLGASAPPPDALQELVRRYLGAFGPATVTDAQTWLGMTGLKPTFAALRPELVVFRGERNKEYFDLPHAPRPPADTPAPVRFLPDFDNLLLSHADRTRVIADDHRNIVYQKGNLRLLPSFLVDGVVAGTWRSERKRKDATLTLTPFAPLPKRAQSELAEEGDRLLHFVEEDAATFAVIFADPLQPKA
ncbi:MAG: winged helix DNA-binding domain-containing protein [Thermomicrobiales bacterium]